MSEDHPVFPLGCTGFISGESDTGKTAMAVRTAMEYIEKGKEVLYFTDKYTARHELEPSPSLEWVELPETSEEILKWVKDRSGLVDMIVIDDIDYVLMDTYLKVEGFTLLKDLRETLAGRPVTLIGTSRRGHRAWAGKSDVVINIHRGIKP